MHWSEFTLLTLALLAAGCGRTRESVAAPVLPESVGGEWQKAEVAASGLEEAPQSARDLGLVRAWKGRYTGASEITVAVYEMPSAVTSFELMQKWRQEPGRTVVRKDAWFYAVDTGETAPEKRLQFLRDFQRQTGAGI